MRKIICIVLLFWFTMAVAVEDAQPHKTRLFILSGQSNMVRLDPDVSFTPALKKAFPDDRVIVIKDAKGGQPIRRWNKKALPSKGETAAVGNLYDRLIAKVKADAVKNNFSTVTFVWMQGERDAKEQHGDQYAAELRSVLDQLKQDIGRDDIYVVLGRLSDYGLKRPKLRNEWEKVRNAQMQVAGADSRSAWVDTDDLNGDKDELHYTDEGYAKFGERLAQAAITLLTK